jgi:hypothetical protein
VNTLAETGFNTVRGAATGVVKGGVDAIIKADFRYFYMDIAGSALSGFSRTVANNIVFGAPYKTVSIKGAQSTYRTGGLANYVNNKILNKPLGEGLTLGTNMYVRQGIIDYETMNHEGYHVYQQMNMGWANFYGSLALEYRHYGFGNGPLEDEAYKFEVDNNRLVW